MDDLAYEDGVISRRPSNAILHRSHPKPRDDRGPLTSHTSLLSTKPYHGPLELYPLEALQRAIPGQVAPMYTRISHQYLTAYAKDFPTFAMHLQIELCNL